jgi:tRNA pseudouridine55 synthase
LEFVFIMDGILIIDKPAGPTSHDVVQMVKRAIGARKVGHTGTLDPAATGVLTLCINGATKKAGKLTGGEKIYEFTLVLGTQTDTDDDTGTVVEKFSVSDEQRSKLAEVIKGYVGSIEQVPPAYSAVKKNGVRSYKRARRGDEVSLEPRNVVIHELTMLSRHENRIRMRMRCEKGTYVRALCRDIGRDLGCGGHAAEIRRIKNGDFTIDQAMQLGDVPERWKEKLMVL